MVQENEILTVILGAGVLYFVILKHAELKNNPSIGLLMPGFCMIFSAWVASLLEAFFWETAFNFLEHMLYLSSALCLLVWTVRLPIRPEGSGK